MGWKASDAGINPDTSKPFTQIELGKKLVKDYKIGHSRYLTDCYTCHR